MAKSNTVPHNFKNKTKQYNAVAFPTTKIKAVNS
jgi:hypothetical protein